nr:hypothetical protein [Chloroflexota bacterium]
MTAAGRQTPTRERVRSKRPAAKQSPPKRSNAERKSPPARKAKKSVTAQQSTAVVQRSTPSHPHLASRATGMLLLLGGMYLAFTGIDPTLGPSGPLQVLVTAGGAAAVPAVVVLIGIALLLLIRPTRSIGGRVLRLGFGALLLIWAIAGLLAVVESGGVAGRVLWVALAGSLGLGALPILLGAILV